MKFPKNYNVFLYICMLLMLSSCQSGILESSPLLKPTPIPIPTEAYIPTPSMTATFTPTLTFEQKNMSYTELLRTNNNCNLPCVWGISPGSTSWQDANSILQETGVFTSSYSQNNGIVHYTTSVLTSSIDNQGTFIKIEILESSNFVTYIKLHGENYYESSGIIKIFNNYAPENIFFKNGTPSKIWITGTTSFGEGNSNIFPYSIWLIYEEQGFIVKYSGAADANSVLKLCPNYTNAGNIKNQIDIYSISENYDSSIEILFKSLAPTKNSLPLEKATGVSLEELNKLYSQNNNPFCLDSPIALWR